MRIFTGTAGRPAETLLPKIKEQNHYGSKGSLHKKKQKYIGLLPILVFKVEGRREFPFTVQLKTSNLSPLPNPLKSMCGWCK